ncbi:MAG TPA: SIR2 family protein [Pyrinomonadaceae bacterium]|jgi:tetratricopeptide (TPR) repeat protein|nr:SIR2 family protein [Pyrinomonadaceae bacterium]
MSSTKELSPEEIEDQLKSQNRLLELDQALTEILQTCRRFPREVRRRPFFFIVGAGVSYPPVPLASDIIKECQEEARRYYADLSEPAEAKQVGAYSYWVGKALPQRGLRQFYFQEKIENQYIPDSNLCLAHLLLDNTITNLVVTTNFDNFLSRALTLFNKPHIICDHPRTAQRIDPERVDMLQLIHVHGTYWFYDSSNLRDEIEKSASSASQMQPLLANILWNRSPLVVGYGGWENDVIMTSLSRRLESELPYNLYWFCYKYDDALKLPAFLYKNPQVYFVVPRRQDPQSPTGPGEARSQSPRPDGGTAAKSKHDEFSLKADTVFVSMARKFDLGEPRLTKEPLPFFAEHLKESLPKRKVDGREEVQDNVFLFKEVINRIQRARAADEAVQKLAAQYSLDPPGEAGPAVEDFIARLVASLKAAPAAEPGAQPEADADADAPPPATPTEPPTGDAVERILTALRSHYYIDAVKIAKELTPETLTPKQARDVMDAMWQAAHGIFDNSQNELDAYNVVIAIGDSLVKADPEGSRDLALRIAEALYNKGFTLEARGDSAGALEVVDEVVRRYQGLDDPAVREQVASALNFAGYITLQRAKKLLAGGGDASAAQKTLRRARELFEAAIDTSPDMRGIVHGNLGYVAFMSGDVERARELLTRAFARGGEEIRQAEIEDSLEHPLPSDEEFRELVNSIPVAAVPGPA